MSWAWPLFDLDDYFIIEQQPCEIPVRIKRITMSDPVVEQSVAVSAAQLSLDKASASKQREQPPRAVKNGGDNIEKLEKENANLQHQLVTAHTTIAQQKADFQKQQSVLNALGHEHQQLRMSWQKAVERVQSHENRQVMRDSRAHQAEEETRQNMQSLVAENAALRSKLKNNESYMDSFLQNAMKDGRWNPLPDDTLRDRLNRLHTDTKYWAKRWSCETLSFSHLTKAHAENCVKLFSNFVRCKADGSLPDAIESPSAKMKGKITQILLTGAVANLLVSEILNKPFFCMDQAQATAMQDIYSGLLKANFQQAHVWRTTVWRIFNPLQSANMSEHDKQVTADTNKRNLDACEKLKADFLLGPASVLFTQLSGPDETERAESLRNILVSATEIATLIWTQRSYLQYLGIADFVEQKLNFSTPSPIMSGHPLNRIDEGDPVHNGREVLVVTQPTILAFDDDDDKGPKGDRFRVLAKAIVWLDDTKKGGLFRRDTS